MADRWIQPSRLLFVTGDEQLGQRDVVTVGDFWRWAINDLRDNTTRGMVAEFLVARAVGDLRERRENWANYDVVTPSGIRVEVKSSGRLRSWSQRQPARVTFGRILGRAWDPDAQQWGEKREIQADVFVFAIQTCTEPGRYDALDLSQWEFRVVSAARISPLATRSINLATLDRISPDRLYVAELREAVDTVHRENTSPTE